MEPFAVAGYVLIASAALLAILIGALAGAIAWPVKGSLPWVGFLAVGAYLADTVLLGSGRLGPAVVIGMPPMIMTFLMSWGTARYLERRGRRRLWATLAGLGGALVLGCSWLFLFRIHLRTPVTVALVADACLVALIYRWRKA